MQITTTFGRSVLTWYFIEEPLRTLQGYARYAKALIEIIPFGFLLLTLLSPWKNLHDRTQERGFNLNRAVESLAYNLLSRGVGCTVRLLTIGIGILLHAVLFACSVLYLSLWMGFPVWAVATVIKALF